MESSSVQQNLGKGYSSKRVRSQSPETEGETPPNQITSNLKRPKLTHVQNSQDKVDKAVQDVPVCVHCTGDEMNLSGRARKFSPRSWDGSTTVEMMFRPYYGYLALPGQWGLGVCYSFDRDRDVDHRHEKVFSTIARDLADRHPEMRRALADALQNASALKTTSDVVQQWQKLLIGPLGKLSDSNVGPVVIVINALDESVPQITQLPKNLRIIVTSRPLCDIDHAFAGAKDILRMSKDNIPAATAEHDIYAYVSNKLEGLLGFGSREFAALAKKAEGLFEWARLACEYIEAPPLGFSSDESFNAVVSRDPAERQNLLYDMYRFILAEIIQKDRCPHAAFQHKQLTRFHSIMGQILGVAEPLPLKTLNAMWDHFPDQNEHYEVDVIVEHLGSLLSGTTNPSTPIRPLHASFRDFLTDRECSKEFFIDVSEAQRDLAFASLGVMEHGLRFNICNMKSSYLPNCKDTGLRERVERCIPLHLSHSSRFWTVHVQATAFDIELAKEVKLFFDHERLLFWLEILGLINALGSAGAALPLIAQWAKGEKY
ncbi:hypothetical protein DFH29DRAFT_1003912 [Suillus ampliporus]|nr:hypothetical protein DFH29DRAFT_1003912 [Suillus ampliporus]